MKSRTLRLTVASGFALALATTTVDGQCVYGLTPASHEAHAAWGTSVAMSGNGQVVLVGGPGADGNDGIVRTFAWDGSGWVEQVSLFPEALYAYSAWFGWSVALSYDGNTAAVGAPGDQHAEFTKTQGAVYAFTRNPDTGQWSQQARLVKPNPSGQQSFGQAVALSDSGDRLVVGQRNHIGSEWSHIPDSAWVFSRQAGTWSAPVELVGTNLAAADEYGYAVAVSPDGQRAVVSAVPAQINADARVFVFRHDGGSWPLEQILDYPEATGFPTFGMAVALGTNVILVGHPGYDKEWYENHGAVHGFDHDGTNWVRQSDVIGFQYSRLPVKSLALRGDNLLIGSGAEVFIVQRMDGQWTFTGTIQSSDPEQNGDFGSAVALAGDRLDYVIGEPRATVEGITEGRAHFVNAVSAPYDFDIQPAGSAITVTIRFMGQPVTIEISPAGDLVGLVMDSCEGAGSFLLTEVTLTNTADHVAFEIPPQVPAPWGGSEVILSNLQVRIAEIGAAATLDDQGMGTLAGYRLEVSGVTTTAGGEPTPFVHITDPLMFTVQLTGGDAEPFDLRLTDVGVRDLPLDVGLGDFNPTLGVQASIGAKNPAPPQRLSISAYGKEAAGFRVEVSGAAGLAVVVEACSDLSASEWTPVSSVTLTDEPLAVIDSDSTPHAARFYRVRSP